MDHAEDVLRIGAELCTGDRVAFDRKWKSRALTHAWSAGRFGKLIGSGSPINSPPPATRLTSSSSCAAAAAAACRQPAQPDYTTARSPAQTPLSQLSIPAPKPKTNRNLCNRISPEISCTVFYPTAVFSPSQFDRFGRVGNLTPTLHFVLSTELGNTLAAVNRFCPASARSVRTPPPPVFASTATSAPTFNHLFQLPLQ